MYFKKSDLYQKKKLPFSEFELSYILQMFLLPSAAQQDNDVNEEQADEDECEVDEKLLQVPLGLGVHLDLRCSTDGRLGHVLDALHEDGGGLDSWVFVDQELESGR